MANFKIYDATGNYARKFVGFCVKTSLFLNVVISIKIHCVILCYFSEAATGGVLQK